MVRFQGQLLWVGGGKLTHYGLKTPEGWCCCGAARAISCRQLRHDSTQARFRGMMPKPTPNFVSMRAEGGRTAETWSATPPNCLMASVAVQL